MENILHPGQKTEGSAKGKVQVSWSWGRTHEGVWH
jgi:hypothetical protein